MKINIQKLYLSVFLLLLTGYHVHAQTFLGLQHSNMSGIHQSVLNPANIANSRHRMYVNGFTAGFGFNNDYLKLNLPFSFMNLITNNVPAQYKNAEGKLDFNESWLKENVNDRPKNMNLYMQFRTPGFMMSLPMGFAIGLQYKNTVSFQINDIAEPLARLARYGIDSSRGSVTYSGPNQFQVGQTFGDNAFTVNMNAYGEIGLTLAKTIIDNDEFLIKAGITPKLLMGYATGYIKNRGLQIKAPGTDTIVFGETDLEYGYTDPGNLNSYTSFDLNVFKNKLLGSGFGYDIGAAFEFKGANSEKNGNGKNNYLFRGGISLLDGGKISYKKQLSNTHITNTGGDKTFVITPEFTKAWQHSTERGLLYTDSVMRSLFQVDTSAKSVQTKMPTTLNLQFDYKLFKIFYLGANLSQDLRGKKNIGIRKASYLVVIPRLESRFVEFALPIGMMNDYRTARVGFFLRVGPLFIGSDNLIGQIRGKNVYGLDLYFGLSMGITKKKDDKDEEGGTPVY